MVICLEQGADLHMAQLMPLPVTVSCFSKIQIGFTFLVPAHPGSPGQGLLNGCVCVCVCVRVRVRMCARARVCACACLCLAELAPLAVGVNSRMGEEDASPVYYVWSIMLKSPAFKLLYFFKQH